MGERYQHIVCWMNHLFIMQWQGRTHTHSCHTIHPSIFLQLRCWAQSWTIPLNPRESFPLTSSCFIPRWDQHIRFNLWGFPSPACLVFGLECCRTSEHFITIVVHILTADHNSWVSISLSATWITEVVLHWESPPPLLHLNPHQDSPPVKLIPANKQEKKF